MWKLTSKSRLAGWAVSVAVVVLIAVILGGCVETKPPGTNTIPAVGTSIEKGKAHVDSAETAVQRIKPHADPTGKELVNVVSDEHKAADKELDKAKAELAQVQKERDQALKAVSDQKTRADKAEATWGYKFGQWVNGILNILLWIAIAHVLIGIAAILVVLWPAAAWLAPWLRWIGAILNPFTWLQFAVDHIHLGCKDTPAPPQQSVAQKILSAIPVV